MTEIENRLVPVLREGVNVVKMVFFKELKVYLAEKYPERTPAEIGRLSGAVLNRVFSTPNTAEPFATYARENKALIENEAGTVASRFENLRIALTDALRVQFLCDSQEGLDNHAPLQNAQQLGILVADRDVPLPKHFMALVRKIGQAYGFIEPPASVDDKHQHSG